MATREIKTRFKLEGEQEYKRAMTDAANAIKVLNSEEKLAKAQFEATGDAQQYAADQARILKEQIENQKRAVKAAEDALANLTKNGVDKNSKQVQTWRTKLNNAKTALYNMQSRLDKVGTELDEETEAFEGTDKAGQDMQSTMEEVAKGINLQNVITAIDNVTEHIEKIVKAAAKAAKAVWEMGVDASTWADGIATAADQAGVDPETYQSWMYASKFIDTSVDDIVRSWKDIDNKLAQEGDAFYEYAGSMAKAGVSIMETNGKMRQGKDIFWDTIDYLHNIADEGTRSSEAMRLFGNDWRKLNPLILNGSAAYKAYAEEGLSVAAVSNENVAALGKMNDNIEDLGTRFDKLKFDTLAALAPTFNEVAQAMSTAITALDEFVQSEEGQAALAELNEALSGVISAFLGEDNGKGTFESIVNTAKDAVKGLTDALDWVSKNGNTVKGIIEGIALAWAGLKVTEGALQVITLFNAAKGVSLKKLQTIFGGNGGPSPTAPSTGTPAAPGAGAGVGLGAKFVSWFSGIKDILGGGAISAGVTALAILPERLANAADRQRIEEETAAIKDAAEAAAAKIGDAGDAAKDAVFAAADAMGISEEKISPITHEGVIADPEAVHDALDLVRTLDAEGRFLSAKTRLLLGYHDREGVTGQTQYDLLNTAADEALGSLIDPQVRTAVSDVGNTISGAMDSIIDMNTALEEAPVDNIEALYTLVDTLANNQDILDSLSEDTRAMIGKYYTDDSFGAGSNSQFTDAQQLLNAVYTDLEGAWNEYVKGGKNLPEGYAEGVNESAGEAADATAAMAKGAIDAAETTFDSHSPSKVFEIIGGNVSVGLANGIYAREDEAIRAAQHLAQSVTNIVQSALQIHSPSKVFERMGEFSGMGFAAGIESSISAVDRAVGNMIGATSGRQEMHTPPVVHLEGGEASAARRGTARSTADPGTVHVTMMLDEEVLGDVMAPIVNDKIGAKINATRR